MRKKVLMGFGPRDVAMIAGESQRPKAIVAVVVFLFIATVIAVVVGTSLLLPNRLMDRLWELNKPAEASFPAIGGASGVALLMLGIGTSAAAVGLLRGRAWAWWFPMVLFAVNGLGDVVNFVVTGDWLRSASGVVVSSVFMLALCGRRVRRYVRSMG